MLPAELAREVKRIQFVTGRQVANVMAGAYLSVFKGRGMEFDEVRPYQPGDEIRTIDWNVTARMSQPFVKRYVEARELTVMLVVDASGSGDFGSVQRFKREVAAELAAVLSFAATNNNDRVGLLIFTDRIDAAGPELNRTVKAATRELSTRFLDASLRGASFGGVRQWLARQGDLLAQQMAVSLPMQP